MSPFVRQELPIELNNLSQIRHENIELYIGVIQSDKEITMITEGNPNFTSLDSFIELQTGTIDAITKLNILQDIARAMMTLIKKIKGPHGHLCPQNVLVSLY